MRPAVVEAANALFAEHPGWIMAEVREYPEGFSLVLLLDDDGRPIAGRWAHPEVPR